MSSCPHPASALKPDTAEQSNGSVTVRFCCNACLTPITKQFMLSVPEPAMPANGLGDLLQQDEGATVAPVRRGANSSWRQYKTSTV
jgi:hypothetical protein